MPSGIYKRRKRNLQKTEKIVKNSGLVLAHVDTIDMIISLARQLKKNKIGKIL